MKSWGDALAAYIKARELNQSLKHTLDIALCYECLNQSAESASYYLSHYRTSPSSSLLCKIVGLQVQSEDWEGLVELRESQEELWRKGKAGEKEEISYWAAYASYKMGTS